MRQHIRTGDVHALRCQGDQITGIADALHHHDVDTMTPDTLPGLDYAPCPGDRGGLGADGFVEWQPPSMTWAADTAYPNLETAIVAPIAVETIARWVAKGER